MIATDDPLDSLDHTIIETAGALMASGTVPIAAAISARLAWSNNLVTNRVARLRRLGLWPYPGRSLRPEDEALIVELTDRGLSNQEVRGEFRRRVGRPLSDTALRDVRWRMATRDGRPTRPTGVTAKALRAKPARRYGRGSEIPAPEPAELTAAVSALRVTKQPGGFVGPPRPRPFRLPSPRAMAGRIATYEGARREME